MHLFYFYVFTFTFVFNYFSSAPQILFFIRVVDYDSSMLMEINQYIATLPLHMSVKIRNVLICF
jgi:hypothetical protein